MREWTTACPDWESRIRSGMSIIPRPIFPDRAEEALSVFKSLKIVDAPGSPTFGESCAQWVFDLVGSIFGAYDEDTGERLITEWFVCLPKKNSKSTIAAGVMLTSLILNWRKSAEFSILAPTVEVANNAFAPARDMCSDRSDEELSAIMHVQTHVKTITHRESNATLKVIAADSDTVGGKKSVGILVDELWLLGKRADAENMLREATGGIASRPEGFIIYLTTQSDDPPAGVFKQKLQYARDVRDGKIFDPKFVPVIYELPQSVIDSGEHKTIEAIEIVNPNIGYSVSRSYLERELTKAKASGEESLVGFLAKHANVEVGMNLRSDRWVGADFWPSASSQTMTFDEIVDRSEIIVVGIDGGGLDDLLGVGVLGRCRKTRKWLHWGHAWAHEIVLKRHKQEASRFLDFAEAGDLTIVKYPGEDVEAVAELVMSIDNTGLLAEKGVGVDASGIGDIIDALTGHGFELDRIVGIPQGWKLGAAIKTTERKLAGGDLVHCGRPMMAWCVGNARVEPRGNAIIITKQASGKAKIDPLMSLFNCCALLAMNPQNAGPIIYPSDYRVRFA